MVGSRARTDPALAGSWARTGRQKGKVGSWAHTDPELAGSWAQTGHQKLTAIGRHLHMLVEALPMLLYETEVIVGFYLGGTAPHVVTVERGLPCHSVTTPMADQATGCHFALAIGHVVGPCTRLRMYCLSLNSSCPRKHPPHAPIPETCGRIGSNSDLWAS